MSVVFSSYVNNKNNINGYFRIGNVTLDIPPSDIITDRIVNNNRKPVIRGKNEMFTKSGQSRWDVTVSWIALIDDTASNPYKQWEDLQTIIAIFKAAPFVEVENKHLRQIFAEKDVIMNSSRLAFGLRQLKIDTHPDIVDGLIVTLSMTYFNYLPYSSDFGYIGLNNQATDAYKSLLFESYLNTWKTNNLVNYDKYFHTEDWKNQLQNEKGKVGLNWKRYKAISSSPKGSNVQPAPSAFVVPVQNKAIATPLNSANGNISKIDTLQPDAASAAHAWLADVSSHGYKYDVTSGRRKTLDSDPGIGQSQTSLYNQYIKLGGASRVGKPGGPKYLVAQPGKSKHESGYAIDIVFQSNSAFDYAHKIAGQYGFTWTYRQKDSVHWDYTGEKTTPVELPKIMSASTVANKLGEQIYQSLGDITDLGPEIQALLDDDWVFDYFTENTAYFFKPESVILRDEKNKHKDHAIGLYPVQLSVLFVNNLAQIPLANYQYPTYQHIGPASSLIAIQMTSLGTNDAVSGEPIHEGLTELTSMTHALEEQFMALRTNFRSVKSIHGMQAIFVENAIFNMLGIFGILNEQVSTEIIKDSSNMVQVSFLAHQYENMYEETEPYKINGITGSYVKTIQNIIGSGSLKSLSNNEQSQLSEVMQFQKDYDNLDPDALGRWILSAAELETNKDFISKFSNNPSITLPSESIKGIVEAYKKSKNTQKFICLNNRFPSLQASGQITYADYLAFRAVGATANTIANDDVISSVNSSVYIAILPPQKPVLLNVSMANYGIISAVESSVSDKKASLQSMYAEILVYLANANVLFASQLQKLVFSPTYKKQFQEGVSSDNPSAFNAGHGAYKDLGLGDIITPSQYFVDNQEKYKDRLLPLLGNISNIITNNSNKIDGLNDPGTTIVAKTEGIPTDPNKLIQMINIPGYSLKEAYPTFKLFFLEDANAGIYYAFDNFYSYSSVLEMEVIRPVDKPATAVIRLTNLSNLFDHKLFDDTLVGKREKDLARFTSPQDTTTDVTTNTQGTSQTVGKNIITNTIDTIDLREGMDPANPKLIPLKYFPLQTGTKIQIRFGFENDPDKLTPVFNGMVTEIQEGDQEELIVTAQSFLLELTTVSGVSATNSAWDLGGWYSIGSDGPAYGGLGIFKDDGTAQTVIKQLLSNPGARHFGHWQLNGAVSDRLLKGYNGWQELSGSVATTLGYTNVAAIINNAYDRSGENIMVNNYVDYNGTLKAGRGARSFTDQSNQGILESLFAPFSYYVDNKLDMSIWELVKDVSRRYPEYLLLEKFYGFPYEADATMVFGSSLDWYYTRPALIGDDEVTRAATNNTALYKEWFRTEGGSAFLNAYQTFVANNLGTFSSTLSDTLVEVLRPTIFSGKDEFLSFSETYKDQASSSFEDLKKVDNHIISILETGVQLGNYKSNLKLAQAAFAAVEKSYLVYAQRISPTSTSSNDDRIKPIRKYHFIDHQSIVHNSIKLNDKVYNVIKIAPEGSSAHRIKANNNIPEHHARVLDVTSRLNDPKRNIDDKSGDFYKLIGQSFLKEELGKMYRGEIILRGIPEIEPMDVLILLDPSTGIVGPVEVDQVIHSFTQEMGYVTIVKPRALILVNETAGAGLMRQLGLAMANSVSSFSGSNPNLGVKAKDTLAASANISVLGGIPNNPVAGFLDLLLVSAFNKWTTSDFADNPIIIQPLFRFNRPWIGGLEGFEITGFVETLGNSFEQLKADEIYPLMDLYKLQNKITS